MVNKLIDSDTGYTAPDTTGEVKEKAKVDAPELVFGGTSRAGAHGPNRDAFAACQPDKVALRSHRGVVMAIADGVGSSQTSRIASELVVTEFINEYLGSGSTRSVRDCAAATVDTLNGWLYAQNAPNRAREVEGDGLMTTFTAVVVKSCTAHIFHAGDSRAWLIRDENAQQLTRDHQVRSSGRLLLARALGADLSVELDHIEHSLLEGDVIALTTDGVHGDLPVSTVRELLVESLKQADNDLESASAQVLDTARSSSGTEIEYDDATCLFARVVSLPSHDEQEIRRRALAVIIPPVLSTGMRIDDLEVISTIYQSTRSHVYLVRRDTDKREFVLKAPSRNFADDALYLQGFARECWLMEGFDHSSLPRSVSPTSDSPFLYSLSEKLPGESLRQWMIDHPTPTLAELRPLLSSIVDGLRALRRAGIVHRDLKPENVIVSAEGGCTIIDFGTARVDGLEDFGISLVEEVPVGAVGYVAPENFNGVVDWRSDLFSLGTIAFEALTGSLPTDSSPKTQGRAGSSAYLAKPLSQIRSDLPPWVEFALRKSLAARPEQRHTSYSEFLEDLRRPSIEASRQAGRMPLAERHPVRFWQCVSAVLMLLLCYSIISRSF
ncbi:bifunctional protein-serine/threonine kinase/phosphatase [Granulosicoccus antarcticus]|uniref:Serine/threonine-protein kinase PknB n=1 Tax=Granulosicoccus antarcticus IMCC3135 TaxID=1192854 RepID=A0A2Z2NT21_9GAMM|nr:bifunctional protein-serine/threonine kinase/phosphatase [Granulosicoccus antarcticus]ASJ73675.1 Serine/threonine-protein kinase PknB [Granulosicoccus antarcticus IMCC3135]